MNRKKSLVVANWKMNPSTLVEAKRLLKDVARKVSRTRDVSVVLCPPVLYLLDLVKSYKGSIISFGAQDVSRDEKTGAFTGEISSMMLKRLGVIYTIVGHSERRARGETDEVVSQKVLAALAGGLVPIVCVGETQRDGEGQYLGVLERQLAGSLEGLSRQKAGKIIVVYEPLWAIGKTAADSVSPEDLYQMSLFIKKILVKHYGRKIGKSIRILYGGSVEPQNAGSLRRDGGVDGFLVGHASLVSSDFAAIALDR